MFLCLISLSKTLPASFSAHEAPESSGHHITTRSDCSADRNHLLQSAWALRDPQRVLRWTFTQSATVESPSTRRRSFPKTSEENLKDTMNTIINIYHSIKSLKRNIYDSEAAPHNHRMSRLQRFAAFFHPATCVDTTACASCLKDRTINSAMPRLCSLSRPSLSFPLTSFLTWFQTGGRINPPRFVVAFHVYLSLHLLLHCPVPTVPRLQ